MTIETSNKKLNNEISLYFFEKEKNCLQKYITEKNLNTIYKFYKNIKVYQKNRKQK